MLPKVFIASSGKSKQLAYDIAELLDADAQCHVWVHSFDPGRGTLETLEIWLDDADFGIFVFGIDDAQTSDGGEVLVTRDNVVFEAGLFIGRHGKSRNFIFVPGGEDRFQLPTDLLGLTTLSYDHAAARKDGVQTLGAPCNKVRRAIANMGRRAASADNFDHVAAVPWRRGEDGLEVAIVKTDSDRWIFPKDFCYRSEDPWTTAERAAFEDIGCQGLIGKQPFASFKHQKTTSIHEITVGCYALAVDRTEADTATLQDSQWVPVNEVDRYFSVGRDLKHLREISSVLELLRAEVENV